ncbi:MAG TPA: amylo-alpha-1,6-glucosidase [Terriglobales bacterium]|nr:amylo-alpha-1,6-glucosidase [Terriglobales bacterium]
MHPDALVRRVDWSALAPRAAEHLLTREWLVTNGLGGYASGTVAGVLTRRYHGALVAALSAPLGRMLMLSRLWERVRLPDRTVIVISDEDQVGASLQLHGARYLTEFRLETGLPVWRYEVAGVVIEKRLHLVYRQNTVHVRYRLVGGAGPVRLALRPTLHFRPHDAPVSDALGGPYTVSARDDRYEIAAGDGYPRLALRLHGARPAFTLDGKQLEDVLYRVEESRGYQASGALWSPGYFRVDLEPGRDAVVVASTEPWETIDAMHPDEAALAERERRVRLIALAPAAAREGPAAELVLAADQFIVTPAGRVDDAARAHAAGDDVRTVIAGYHWFTDWGRDTMISLEGLTLSTGRASEAGYILRTFAHYVRDGLIPNLFPEGDNQGLYHTADATLWFFHAIDRYVTLTGDRTTLGRLLPKLADIVEHHLRGTHFGIGVDAKDGLLRQGAPGYQLTWMDAKVDDWVVTPRRGKAVEINALWYNALRLLEAWLREAGDADAAGALASHAAQVAASFNERFWYADGQHLYDVVDGESGDDAACRPNQVLAIALRHPVLDAARWPAVLESVHRRLLTPVGLRSLAPGHPDYKAQYYGDLRARDAAYHQGTVWGWLIGPWIDAWLKVHPDDRRGARRFLEAFVEHLDEACIGSISEVFDAEPPFTPRGCVAQAWSVAEVLRCWLKTAD